MCTQQQPPFPPFPYADDTECEQDGVLRFMEGSRHTSQYYSSASNSYGPYFDKLQCVSRGGFHVRCTKYLMVENTRACTRSEIWVKHDHKEYFAERGTDILQQWGVFFGLLELTVIARLFVQRPQHKCNCCF